MRFDIFFSICQTEVGGYLPSEKVMFNNFFTQIRLADELGFGCAWLAETHLSCQVQKQNPGAVIPHFKGEIGLNTDVLQMAHKVFSQTKHIHIGSAIRNILCNGGPVAHAEAVRMFLSIHAYGGAEQRPEQRLLELGFASGRFPFSNFPYGIKPRNELETRAWPALRGLIFLEATEIFLRFLRGDIFRSADVTKKSLRPSQLRSEADWSELVQLWKKTPEGKAVTGVPEKIEFAPFWNFDQVGVVPFAAPLELLRLTIGAHDATTQIFANQFLPVGVFNLSITPSEQIEETHARMQIQYNKSGGPWDRAKMPRTVLVFIDHDPQKAKTAANLALATYWLALEGTLDPKKIEQATNNALVGTPAQVVQQVKERFHPDDRLMLWFDFNNHDNESVCHSMRLFMEKVAPNV